MRLFKRITALALAAVTAGALGLSAAADMTEDPEDEYIGGYTLEERTAWGIDDYAENIRTVFKLTYPDEADVIDDIVDAVMGSDVFAEIFAEDRNAAVQIVEDSLRDALEPDEMPAIFGSDTYISIHGITPIKQISGYSDGAAAAVLMALYGCGYYDDHEKDDDGSLKKNRQENIIGEIAWNSNNKTHIGEVTRVLRKYYNKSSVWAFQTKAATTFGDMIRMAENSLEVDAAPVIRVPNGTGYYYGVVLSIVETDEVEDVCIINPITGTKQFFSFDELERLLFSNNNGAIWMSVYSVDKKLQGLEKVMAEYPDGSYFNKSKTEACTCHSWCNENSLCGCMKYEYWDENNILHRSSQCAAFAMYVYESVTGINYYISEKTNITYVNETLNATTARKNLKGLPVGTYVRVLTGGGTKHSISIIETTDDGITIYHANYGNALSDKCKISLETISWATFATRFTKLLNYVD